MKNNLIINSGQFIKKAFKNSFEKMHKTFFINYQPLLEHANKHNDMSY